MLHNIMCIDFSRSTILVIFVGRLMISFMIWYLCILYTIPYAFVVEPYRVMQEYRQCIMLTPKKLLLKEIVNIYTILCNITLQVIIKFCDRILICFSQQFMKYVIPLNFASIMLFHQHSLFQSTVHMLSWAY